VRRLLLALLLAAGCRKEALPEAPPGAPGAELHASAAGRWVPARRAEDAPVEQYPARVLHDPGAVAAVGPSLAARVEKVHRAPGDQVRRGDVLFTVLVPEATTALAVQGATGGLIQALERRREQLRALRAEGLARSSDLFAIEVDLARAQAERARAAATLRGLGGSATELRSPIDGVVVEQRAAVGEWRRPEEGPLARIAEARASRVEVRLMEPPGGEARFELELSGVQVPLRLISSAPRPGGDAQGYLAWFAVPEGTTVRPAEVARVAAMPPPGALVVESRALLFEGGKAAVVARVEGKATRIPVEVLRVSGSSAWVRGGLAPGVPVSTAPSAELSPEAP
jgi:multidrug efflux pump subunit AcrA (membrane-fusion protein)